MQRKWATSVPSEVVRVVHMMQSPISICCRVLYSCSCRSCCCCCCCHCQHFYCRRTKRREEVQNGNQINMRMQSVANGAVGVAGWEAALRMQIANNFCSFVRCQRPYMNFTGHHKRHGQRPRLLVMLKIIYMAGSGRASERRPAQWQHVFAGDAIETMNYGDFNANSPGVAEPRHKCDINQRQAKQKAANCSSYTPREHTHTHTH